MSMLFMCEVPSDLHQMTETDTMVTKVGMPFLRIIVRQAVQIKQIVIRYLAYHQKLVDTTNSD